MAISNRLRTLSANGLPVIKTASLHRTGRYCPERSEAGRRDSEASSSSRPGHGLTDTTFLDEMLGMIQERLLVLTRQPWPQFVQPIQTGIKLAVLQRPCSAGYRTTRNSLGMVRQFVP